jgi:hypothetical protein
MKIWIVITVLLFTWFAAGKLMIYLARLWAYKEEMNYRSQFPHATPPPEKPTFFNNKKR